MRGRRAAVYECSAGRAEKAAARLSYAFFATARMYAGFLLPSFKTFAGEMALPPLYCRVRSADAFGICHARVDSLHAEEFFEIGAIFAIERY